MKILYVARMARFGVRRPTCKLACYIACWTPMCDRQLLQLVSHIHSSYEHRLTGWLAQDEPWAPRVYVDADFAGDPATQRSTTGVHLCIEGENSHFPLHGVSKRQDCVSSSTPEAELVSGHYAYHTVLLPAMDLWETLLPTAGKGILRENTTAMAQVIRAGRNPTMKRLRRAHRICVATLHERLVEMALRTPLNWCIRLRAR